MNLKDFKTEEDYISQMNSGALLNPRIDSTFKALFTSPTKEAHDALHSFLEAATNRKIRSFTLTANEAPTGFMGQRGVTYDIACEFDDGLSADIEMQAFEQKYDYGKRAEYQVARLETTYLKKGSGWEKAPVVYQITVLDFSYDPENKDVVSRYAMRTKDGRELSNSLNLVFIDLTKVSGIENKIEENSKIENWAVFLKDADNPSKKDIIRTLTGKEEGLMQAQKSLSSISSNRELWFAQYRQEIAEIDRISALNAMHREGLELGRAEGRAEGLKLGIAEGRNEAKIELIKNALKLGLSLQQVAQISGLSEEEIKNL